MGGLVIKDLLVTAQHQSDDRLRRISTAAAGAVFYSVPHAGSRLADWGWILRYVGGSPAKHVRQLKSGPHQEVSVSYRCHQEAVVGWRAAVPGCAASVCLPWCCCLIALTFCYIPPSTQQPPPPTPLTTHPAHPPPSTASPYPIAPQELNAAVRALSKGGRLPVLSFSEGRPTRIGLVETLVVPHESAWPG